MKKMMLLCCVLFMLMPVQVFAHSKLTESTPAADETIAESPTQISMKYNTTISSVSTFTLVNEAGEVQQVDNISVNHDELTGEVSSPLANGVYTVEWNIIGADGHPIEGNYSFTVQAAEPEPTAAVEPETDAVEPEENATPTPDTDVEPEETNAADSNQQVTEQTEAANNSTNVWPYVVIGILIVAAVAFAMRKRK